MKQCISLFIFLFVFANCLAVPFSKGIADNFVKGSSLEQILFAVQTPSDILSSMMQTDKTSQQNKENKKQKDTNLFYEYLLPVEITLPAVSSISSMLTSNISIYATENFVSDVEYPIKIPFLDFIFLLLILKVIFTMLKRSISINYNKINIDRACIV
ncbi:hypothetical protein [Candidatus Ruminimicrobiellum ovillum]|uniref:hypothetical protein n=1 Tax=Candidatus Ruminimicrobiellum ovillum TaxID=1947927 RepID=UPI00355A5DDA